ncbi:MAG: GDSL family lipase [Clostridia bacterium]|nr:GDSL family lipase [Clostridia bacterium]
MQKIIPTWANVKPLGRTWQMADSLWMAFSGTGAEFAFTGSFCRLTIAGDSTSLDPENTANHARIAIYADGVRVADMMINAPEKTCTVVDGAAGEHVIRVVKLSETAMSTCGIKCIEADGDIRPTPLKAHLVEFIGDSITCGYGVDDEDPEHHFVTGTEDATCAYAYRTAQLLDADYSLVSISGYGVISGYTATAEEPVTAQLIPRYYDKLGFSYGEYGGCTPADVAWDFTARQPELIVLNLGTNDDSYCLDYAERQEHYCTEYTKFLHAIRERNPGAKILCVLGMMGDRLYPFVVKAVAAFSASTGDGNIACMHFTPQLEEDGRAADYHPTEVAHQKAAEKLAGHIRRLLNW